MLYVRTYDTNVKMGESPWKPSFTSTSTPPQQREEQQVGPIVN